MKRLLAVSMMAMMTLTAGCATPTKFDMSNDSLKGLSDNPVGTYSDWGKKIEFSDEDKLYHLNIFVGGLGSCDNGAILYAKPKLDDFMKENKFNSYKIIKGEYSLFPLSKCELYVQFES